MLIYWLLFLLFVVGSILTVGSAKWSLPGTRTAGISSALLIISVLLIALLIGFRYKVGADWNTYYLIFKGAGFRPLAAALQIGDPAYQFVNWTAYHQGFEIWSVNLVCGLIFSLGLWRFCRTLPFPWLSAAIAVPYMVVVVAMGYSRQGVALGILMAGLASYKATGSALRFALYVAAAALFHRTAVVAFPIVALVGTRSSVLNLLLAVSASILLYDLFLGDSMDDYIRHYIDRRYSSQGAAIRVSMNVISALVFWLAGHRLEWSDTERKLWRNFSIAAAIFALLLVASPSSTAVDRMSIYVMPLQLAVLSRLPLALSSRLFGATIVLTYMGLVQFVWLNFAQFSRYWLPYQFFPI